MGIFTKVKDYFAKPESYPEPVVEAQQTPKVEGFTSQNFGNRIEECSFCNNPIETYQKRRTYLGKKWHKNCFRKAFKDAKARVFN
jgi:hypothetical protein